MKEQFLKRMRVTMAAAFTGAMLVSTGAFADPAKSDPKEVPATKERTGDKAGTQGETFGGQQSAGQQDTQNRNRKDEADMKKTSFDGAAGSYPNNDAYRSQHDSADKRTKCEPKTKEKGSKACMAKPTTTDIEPRVPQGQPAN